MTKSLPKSSRENPYPAGGVMAADAEQWRKWQDLSPAERLEAANRLWQQSREIRKQVKRNLRFALGARAERV